MAKLKLNHTDFLVGSFQPKKINLIFIFQLSSPKAMLEAAPVFNDMYNQYKKEIGFVGLSTAIEDYKINTKENTIDWLVNKTVFGNVANYLDSLGKDEYPNKIQFPVTCDPLLNAEAVLENDIEQMMQLNRNYKHWSESDKISVRLQIRTYLMRQEKIAYTFTYNQLRDVPAFVIFNKEFEILETWYDHKNRFEVKEVLEKYL